MTTLLRFAVVVILSVLALDVGAAFAETPQKESKKQSGSESDKSNSKNPAGSRPGFGGNHGKALSPA